MEKESLIYTCPMHPAVQTEKPGMCPVCGMNLVMEDGKRDTKKMASYSSSIAHHSTPYGHAHHDHASMLASPNAARDFLRRFYVVTALLIPLAVFSEPAVKYFHAPDFLGRQFLELAIATIIFGYGWIFFQHARHEILARQYGMMTLVSLGVGSGYLFSMLSAILPGLKVEFYLEISTLIWVLLFGHFLEAKSSTAAGDALAEVAKLLPKDAHRKTKTGVTDVAIAELIEGDIVLVKASEKVPADGTIVLGSATFNEAHISGESKPVAKQVGSLVIAGAINLDGSVEVRLTRIGESSTIGQIQKLIATAQQTKPTMQRLADRAARWLTFGAITAALTALLVWSAILGQPLGLAMTLAITVLVIACPHALGLAIPTVTTIATRLAVTNGIFIKNMAKLEEIRRVDYVVLDKTGTLTKGEFGVTEVRVLAGERTKLLQVVGGIEAHSSHGLGQAILAYLKPQKITPAKVTAVKNLAGRGMQAKLGASQYIVGNQRLIEERKLWNAELTRLAEALAQASQTPVFVADAKQVIGFLALADALKPESKAATRELHGLGVKVAMLTGDTQGVAAAVGQELGIDTVFAEVLPEDKYRYIRELQAAGHIVLMAGDGVNDAPALTQANVGVAIGAGTDVAVEAGDVILTQSNPQHIVRLIVLARKVYTKMVQNLWWAVGYNILAIPAAAGLFIPLGFQLTPAVGALLMSLSSVIVVLNAISLRRFQLRI